MPKKGSSRRDTKGNRRRPRRDIPLSENELKLFYSHIYTHSRTAATRVLSNVQDGNPRTEWTEGYSVALEGMVHSLKDQSSLLNRLTENGMSEKYLLELHKQFEARTQNPLSEPYDQGYFSAWVNLLYTISGIRRDDLEI